MTLRRVVLLLIALPVAAVALTLAAVIGSAWLHEARAADPPAETDMVLVFGGEFGNNRCVRGTDTRMVRGLEIATAQPDVLFAVSETVTPYADLVRGHAAVTAHAHGLSVPENFLVEPRAISTFENVRFTLALLDQPRPARVTLVTDAVHMARARLLWRYFAGDWPDYALAPTRGAPLSRERVRYYLREAAAWWLNAAKIIGWEALALAGIDETERGRLIR